MLYAIAVSESIFEVKMPNDWIYYVHTIHKTYGIIHMHKHKHKHIQHFLWANKSSFVCKDLHSNKLNCVYDFIIHWISLSLSLDFPRECLQMHSPHT